MKSWQKNVDANRLRENIESMITEISEKVEQADFDGGDFPRLSALIENEDEALPITHFALNVMPPPPRLLQYKGQIKMELAVYKMPLPYKGGVLKYWGTKDGLLDQLKQPALADSIMKSIFSLADGFNDIR